jgi:hypothetical protein
MTDRYRVYTKVLKVLKQMLQMRDQRHLVTLAMMVAGIVTGRNAQLSAMSSEILIAAKEKSIEMRLRRWVEHSEIDAEVMYMPFALQILEALASLGLVLVMDGSQAGRGCMVLMVGVVYKQCALPIAWIVYKGKKEQTTLQRHIQALEKVLPLLPAGYEVVLLGDAEYDTIEMIAWVQENTAWSYVLRTSPQIYVQEGQQSQSIRDCPMAKGQVFQRHQVGFTQSAEVSLNLIG